MSAKQILNTIRKKSQQGKKQFAVLIDPDKTDFEQLTKLIHLSQKAPVDFFLIGGSLLIKDGIDEFVRHIKELCEIPVLLFPGNAIQVSKEADGILFLSLISGRNPEFLIGQHVVAAPFIKQSQLEVLPTGYMLIDGGEPTSVSYMSNTQPIPHNKPQIAVSTAIAGEMLGLQLLYLDAGSGASQAVNPIMIREVKKAISHTTDYRRGY